jgi:hypothetical protein
MGAELERPMAVEEVVLSVPGHSDGVTAPAASTAPASEALEHIVRDYFAKARARDRIALGGWMRDRRRERYDLALKTLVKAIATEASRNVEDRGARVYARTQIYASVMSLVRMVASDHLVVIGRARRMLCWALAFAVVAVAGVVYIVDTLIGNG